MNDLLMVYAKIVSQICPAETERFTKLFIEKLGNVLPMANEKTLNNHRTENVQSLLGMVFEDENRVYSTERNDKLLSDGDLPAFFKDWCFKVEFPNGWDKIQTIRERVGDEIKLRPCCFIVQLLTIMQNDTIAPPTVDELGYYVLNSRDVLMGKVTPSEVSAVIALHRKEKKRFEITGGNKAFAMQHIRELLGYMEFANLISVEKHRRVKLNNSEVNTVEIFRHEPYGKLLFDVYKYDLASAEDGKALRADWREYVGKVAFRDKAIFETPVLALIKEADDRLMELDTSAIGDEGEKIVFRLEKERVGKWDDRYVDRVKIVGATKGLGYDVHSVAAEGKTPKNAIYIEVKTTKRVTAPEIIDDSVEMTRNEWDCAEQNGENYLLYRIYLTDKGVYLFKIRNPATTLDAKAVASIRSTAVKYRVEFKADKKELQLIKV